MTSVIPNYLCEQDQWHVACSDSHTTAAAALAQRDEYLERRQLGQFFQSVGGVIASFFDPPPAPSPPAPPSGPPKPERTTASQAPASTKAAKSSAPATTLSPTTRTKTSVASTKVASTSDPVSSAPTTSDPTPITSSILESIPTDSATSTTSLASNSALPASSPSSTPAPSSGISGGAIAGIVIGALAFLALLGVLAVFLLRKKRKESNAEHLRALDDNGRVGSMEERLMKQPAVAVTPMAAVAAAPMTIARRPIPGAGVGSAQDEKRGVYRSDGRAGAEMGTSFNAWELDSREVARPVIAELESPITEARPQVRDDARGAAASRRDRDEMHF